MLIEKIGLAAMLEQTAEEASELAFACLKYARYLRGDNKVYGYSEEDLKKKITEEAADVDICITELLSGGKDKSAINFSDFTKMRREKRVRMKKRLEEKNSYFVPAPPEKAAMDDIQTILNSIYGSKINSGNEVEIGFIKTGEDTCKDCAHKDECKSHEKDAGDYIKELESALELLPKAGDPGFNPDFDARLRKRVDMLKTLKNVFDIITAVEKEDKEGNHKN